LNFVSKIEEKLERILDRKCDYIQIEGYDLIGKQIAVQKYT